MIDELHARHLIGVDDVRELWLIRHADAYSGLEGLSNGRVDPPLSKQGQEQLTGAIEQQQWAGAGARAGVQFQGANSTGFSCSCLLLLLLRISQRQPRLQFFFVRFAASSQRWRSYFSGINLHTSFRR